LRLTLLCVVAAAAVAAVSCKKPEPAQQPTAAPTTPEVEACSAWLEFVCNRVDPQDTLCLTVQEGISVLTEEACAVAYAQRAFTEAQLAKRKLQCGVFADKVCADMPGETRFCKTVRERVVKYTPNFCVDMLNSYPETLAQLRKQLIADRLSPERAAQLYAGDPPSFGPKDAAIQMVAFVDYESIYSPKTAAIVRRLAAKYEGRLHFVLRQFPLPDNPHAQLAAQAALAAHAQGKYWSMHDMLLENRTQLDRASLLRYAKVLGLDTAQLKAALDGQRYAPAVAADIALGKAMEVVGMPTVFIDNERIMSSVDEAGMVAAIEEHLARKP
jgi:protein-disulfide isomerase